MNFIKDWDNVCKTCTYGDRLKVERVLYWPLHNSNKSVVIHKSFLWFHPGGFRSWESPQTFPALFIGSFEHVERFRNSKFAVIRIVTVTFRVLF